LALGHGEFAETKALLARLGEHFAAVEEEAGEAGLAADEDVVLGGEVGEGDGFLVDDGDASGFGGADAAQVEGRAGDEDLAGIREDRAGEGFDEGGLAGAVFAAEGVDFAGLALASADFEGNGIEGADADVGLGEVVHADEGMRGGWGGPGHVGRGEKSRKERRTGSSRAVMVTPVGIAFH